MWYLCPALTSVMVRSKMANQLVPFASTMCVPDQVVKVTKQLGSVQLGRIQLGTKYRDNWVP